LEQYVLRVAVETRQQLIDAATRAFAEDGVHAASLVEITRRAGQRNRGAVHYHFGGRDGLLVAVLEEQAPFLARREGELLAVARQRPASDVGSVIEAIVRPAVELAERGWRGRAYLAVVGELVEQDQGALPAEVAAALRHTGGYEVFAVLAERLPSMDDALLAERFALTAAFVIGSVARRARAGERVSRPQLSTESFVSNLVSMAAAMLAAPLTNKEGS
jgi:AcrR family transcriptional regulator